MSFSEREDLIFEEIRKRALDLNEDTYHIARDGLLFRGEFKYEHDCWTRYPGEEDLIWDNASNPMIILTKDTPLESELYDIRIESGMINFKGPDIEPTVRNAFYDNLHLWTFGILEALNNGNLYLYDDTPSWEELREYYERAPLVRMNCRKQMGDKTISNSKLSRSLKNYKEQIKEQIQLYDGRVILCCGGSSIIKNFVKEVYLPDLFPVVSSSNDPWLYYSKQMHKLVINSYHPSYARARSPKVFDSLMNEMKIFVDQKLF